MKKNTLFSNFVKIFLITTLLIGFTSISKVVEAESLDDTATLSGYKFEDLDADGNPREVGEPGLGGWRIYVDYDDDNVWDADVEPSALTASDGSYSITNILPGQYKVREVGQDGWNCSTPNLPDDLLTHPVISTGCFYWDAFTSRAVLKGNDFGHWRHAVIAGYKWEDRFEPYGEWDQANEPTLPGWSIELFDLTSGTPVFVATANTNGSGYYEFSMVDPGRTYVVCELISFSHEQTFPMASTIPPAGETTFACSAELGSQYGSYGYQFTASSNDKYMMNNFGNKEPSGCTYTEGYWKTHSKYGPTPEEKWDEGWYTPFGPYPYPDVGEVVSDTHKLYINGPDTLLFDSGFTWQEVFRSPDKAGNAWYILAHQWMGAYLNYYNGAGAGGVDVVQWLADSATLLDAYDDGGIGNPLIPKDSPDRNKAIELADWLEKYNNGYWGPGYCSE